MHVDDGSDVQVLVRIHAAHDVSLFGVGLVHSRSLAADGGDDTKVV